MWWTAWAMIHGLSNLLNSVCRSNKREFRGFVALKVRWNSEGCYLRTLATKLCRTEARRRLGALDVLHRARWLVGFAQTHVWHEDRIHC